MIYHKNELIKLMEDSKIVKSRIITTLPGDENSPGIMIGCSDELSYLKVMTYPNNRASIFANAISDNPNGVIPFTDLIKAADDGLFVGNCGKDYVEVPEVNRFTNVFFNNVYNAYKNIILSTINAPTTIYRDIHLNPDFLRIQSSYGEFKFRVDDKHQMYLYPGLININKSDKVDLTIYDLPNNIFVCMFSLAKPKNVVISIYIKCRTI